MRDLRTLWRDRGKWLVIIVVALIGYWLPSLIDLLDTNWRYAWWGFAAGVLVCAISQQIRDRLRLRSEVERADEQRLANQRRGVSAPQ